MQEVYVIVPIIDTTINSNMPLDSFGDYYALFIGKYLNKAIYRSLLLFDISILPSNYIVKKADLVLYLIRNDYKNYVKKFEVFRLLDNFNNKTTFQTQPKTYEKPYSTFTIFNEINTFINIDITNLFTEWYKGKHTNYGLLLKSHDESINSLVAFFSKESKEKSYIPKLKITLKNSNLKETKYFTKSENEYSSEAYFNMANKYFEYKDYNTALSLYNKAFKKINPREKYTPKLLLNLVLTLDKLNKFEEALNVINDGLSYFPKFTDLEYLRGCIYEKKNLITLAIKSFKKCIDLGEPPIHLNFLIESGSYNAYLKLAEIYFNIEDFEKAYYYCQETLKIKPKYKKALVLISKILFKKQKEVNYIKNKIESYLDDVLKADDYIILGDIFFDLKKYDISYEYYLKAKEFINTSDYLNFSIGMCLLHLKNYNKAYDFFASIKKGKKYDKAIYGMILCSILSNNLNNINKLLNKARELENSKYRIVYNELKNLIYNQKANPLSYDKTESAEYIDIIFEVLDILLISSTPEVFEKSLELLNLIDNNEVLLRLAKLYYNNNFFNLAYQEFIRSIKIFGKIDIEGSKMLTNCMIKLGKF